MMMICNVPNEVVKNVKMGTWCGSSVAEKMIANGIPLEQLRAEIKKAVWEDVVVSLDGTDEVRIPRLEPDDVFEIIDKYRGEIEDT